MYYTVIGTQWGDEGKGKIVDWLASRANFIIRFQGGNNAGHTIKIDNNIYKLNLLPSGIIRNKKCMIGNGVVLDPWALLDEIDNLKKQGIEINKENLFIAENVCLILPLHKIIDEINEISRGKEIIGTTKKGIGPAYEDKVGRRSIRLSDLNYPDLLKKKLHNLLDFHKPRFDKFNKIIDLDKYHSDILKISGFLLEYSCPVWKMINLIDNSNNTVLFEGAQGSLLDIDFGTYPYVTSSNTLSGQVFAGSGLGSKENHTTFGITKAYTTRVGSGPFPTELNNSIGDHLIDKGKEFGTVTKRKRRCGWFDAILVKQSVILNGINEIVLTKLDVLDELEKIDVCVGYKINGKHYDYLPLDEVLQGKIEPIYKSLKGWKQKTYGIQDWKDLPVKAKEYIEFLEKTIQKNISIISTGPDRKETIDKNNILSNI
tara:strand:+ start:4291 stop:5577 length:1287 start_codon:yes stop_codon:yes gene_type:complete